MARVRFSRHAVERYVERVKPGLSFGAAAAELEGLLWSGALELTDEAPAFCGSPNPDDGFLRLGDIAFPLLRKPSGYLLATTCRTPESQRERERIEARREAKRKARTERRWRANRKSHPEAA